MIFNTYTDEQYFIRYVVYALWANNDVVLEKGPYRAVRRNSDARDIYKLANPSSFRRASNRRYGFFTPHGDVFLRRINHPIECVTDTGSSRSSRLYSIYSGIIRWPVRLIPRLTNRSVDTAAGLYINCNISRARTPRGD